MTIHRPALVLSFLAIPSLAFALNFTNVTNQYTDAPFSTAETAGISVLTNLGAVSGNPDGTFAADKTLNRAEFVKIVLKSFPTIAVADTDGGDCFPDVHNADWFSRYVCLAKERGIIDGYPDGFFRPGNAVNYVEALKILTMLYAYGEPVICLQEGRDGICTEDKVYGAGDPWYEKYVDWAAEKGVLLTGNTAMGASLTRGQMARLAAGFRAMLDGELVQYRAFERGETMSSSLKSSNASSQITSTSSSSASSVSSASSASSVSFPVTVFPSISRFHLLGQRSLAAIDGTFTAPDEDGYLRFADVTLRREVKSIAGMSLIDADGKDIGNLILQTDNNADHRKWRLVVTDNSYIIKKGVLTTLGVAYTLRERGNGGIPNELIDGVETFSITVAGVQTNASRQLVPAYTHYPQSQTAEARITGVANAGSGAYAMKTGANRLLGRFAVSGLTVTGGILKVESLDFTLASTDAIVTNIRVGGPALIQQSGCGIDASLSSHIICSVMHEDFKTVGKTPLILSLYGDVTLREGSTGGSLQVLFPSRGKIGDAGSIRWADSVGKYNWIESTSALENGTVWTVSP